MKKFTDEFKKALLKAAKDVNFYGKRKRMKHLLVGFVGDGNDYVVVCG